MCTHTSAVERTIDNGKNRVKKVKLAALVILAAFVWMLAQPPVGRGQAVEQRLLYVALDNRVAVYDIDRNHAFVRNIPMSNTKVVRGIQACAQTRTLYVSAKYFANESYGGLVAIDLVTEKIRWRKQFEKEVDAFSLTPDCKKIYASTGEVSVKTYDWVLDAADGDILTTIPVSPVGGSHNAVVGPSGKRAYLSSLLYEYLVVADTATDKVTKKVGPFGGGIRPFVVNGRETLAFVNVNYLQGFEVADLQTGKIIHRVKFQPQIAKPNSPNPVHGIGLTADETELWQTGADRKVYVFDATVMPPRQIASVGVSELPKWISFSIDNRYVYTGTGQVIDRRQRKVVANIARSKRQVEVDFAGGVPVRAADMYGLGYVGVSTPRNPSPSPSTPSGAPSLLRNGGFEQDADGDGRPDIWSEAASATRSATIAHSGTYSMRHQSSSNGGYRVWQAVSNVEPGASYTIGGWFNIPPTSDAFEVTLELAWKGSNGTELRTDVVKKWNAATNGWQYASTTVVAPSGTKNAVLRMKLTSLAATVYADDLVLRR